jgi:hypothetical protein
MIELSQLADEPTGNFRLIVVSQGLDEVKLKQNPIFMLQDFLKKDLA